MNPLTIKRRISAAVHPAGTITKSFLVPTLVFSLTALVLSGCGGMGPLPPSDTTAPTVSSVSPVNGAQNVSVNSSVMITFSEAIDESSINAQTITLSTESGNVEGSVTYSGTTAVFKPSSILNSLTLYTVTIDGSVRDAAGNAMGAPIGYLFKTGIAQDTTPPQVTSTSPASDASGVNPSAISVTFTEAMDPSTIVFIVTTDAGNPVSGTVTYSGKTTTFTPSQHLAYLTKYIVAISKETADLAANKLGIDYVWSFTTGSQPDTTPPTITAVLPANGTQNVAINIKLNITFSEDMKADTITTGSITVKSQAGASVPGTVLYSSKTANFAPNSLDYATVYIVTITTAVADLSGNAMATPYVFTFTTGSAPDTTRPHISATTPINGAVDCAINASISVTFNEPMDPGTINNSIITLRTGTVIVQGTVTYAGTTAIFTPTTNTLSYSTLYTAGVSTAAKDLAENSLLGNQPNGDYQWSFTTGSAPDTTPPVITALTPTNGAISVDVNTAITVTFSEPVDESTIHFELSAGGTTVPWTISYVGLTATFTTTGLSYSTTYAALVTGARDLAQNQMANCEWSFRTAEAGTTTKVESSLNPSTFSDSVTFTAQVTTSGGGTPTGGIVTFRKNGAYIGAVALSGGAASLSTSALSVGSHSITAEYSGSPNFPASTSSSYTQEVIKAPATVTLANLSQTYDGTPKSATALTNPTGLSVTFTYNGISNAPINAGTYTVVGTINDTNYQGSATGTLTVTARSITITAEAKTKVYGEADPSLTYTITSGSLINGDSITGSLSRAAGKNVGLYAIQQGTLTADGNYVIIYSGANLNITARPITITADAKTKVYGVAEDPALTYTFPTDSLVNGDSITGSLSRTAGENVGLYAIQQGTLTAGSNYATTYVSANLSITARPITITADAKTKVYGVAEDPALTYTFTPDSLVNGDSITGSLTRDAGETVLGGPYAIRQGTLAVNSNYQLTYVGADLNITARLLIITAGVKTKVYGEADPVLTYTSVNLINGDSITGSLSRAAGKNVGLYAIQQGTLTADGNYVIIYSGANLNITARPITITADAKTKVYGVAEDPALTYTFPTDSLVNGDSITGSLSRDAGETVLGGPYAIRQGTLVINSNYQLTYVGADMNITGRLITITADAKTKNYGEIDPALTYTITSGDLIAGDALTGSLTRDTGEDFGSYLINLGTLTAGSNYEITYVSANLEIY